MNATHHRTLIIGGGAAGITVAAQLRRWNEYDVAVLEPRDVHYYQPLWTLVGAGESKPSSTVRAEARVIPDGVTWIRDGAAEIDPDDQQVRTVSGRTITYDFLVVAPGIQLDWDAVPGLDGAVGHDGVASNYTYDTAQTTWEYVRSLRGGTAVFTMPSGPIKCGGAPQKAAYMSCDHWRRTGVLDDIDVHLVLPTPTIFGVPEFARVLDRVVERYGITVHLQSELSELRPEDRTAVITDHGDGGSKSELSYDFLHVVPPQSAPDWIKASPLSTGEGPGYVDVDKYTTRHVRWPNVFSLGDASSLPCSKTGAAVRKEAPVLVKNLLAQMQGRELTERYNGYSSCPIVTAKGRMLLCEFDYDLNVAKSIPVIDTAQERYDMWLLKKYGLPMIYWYGMLKGLV